MSRDRILLTDECIPSWTTRVHDWYYTGRFQKCLRERRGWAPEVVESVANESLRILKRTPDPTRSRFSGRGLVVGYVQSGKTASYTAVAARAADAGYRLVIILSGIHDSLRSQ